MKKNLKMLLNVGRSLLLLVLLFVVLPTAAKAETVDRGSCGANVNWTLDDTGTLTIFGTGEMQDYGVAAHPWHTINETVKKIVIEDGVTSIGACAFYGCIEATELDIGKDVEYIGENAFNQCFGLTDVTIPANVKKFGFGAFSSCKNLAKVTFKGSAPELSCDQPFSLPGFYGACENLKIWYYHKSAGFDTEVWKQYKIAAIHTGDWKVVEEATCTETGLRRMNCSVCGDVEEVVPKLKHNYQNGICVDCSDVEIYMSGKLGENVTYTIYPDGRMIVSGTGPTYNTDETPGYAGPDTIVTKVIIEDGVTSIGNARFFQCFKLQSITIPNSVTRIGYGAFEECKNLKSVTIPEGVEEIGARTFVDCKKLQSITIPASVNSIESAAFDGCLALEKIVFEGDMPDIYKDAFEYVDAKAYYPAGNSTYNKTVMKNYGGDITWVKVSLPAPTITVSVASNEKPVVSWDAVKGAATYQIYRATSKKGSYTKVGTTDKLSYEDNAAVAGKVYYYKAVAVSKKGSTANSKYSNIVSVTTKCGQPSVTVSKNEKGYPVLEWNEISGATKYEVYYATTKNGTYKKLAVAYAEYYTYHDAASGKVRFFKVRAVGNNASTAGVFSEPVRAIKKLATPRLTITTKQTTGQNTIKWKKVTGATSYVLQCSANGGEYKDVTTTTKLSYVHKGLSGGSTYTYRLMAKAATEDANSAFSSEKIVVVKCAKPAVDVSLNNEQKPVIKWNAVAGAKEYQVFHALSGSSNFKLVATVSNTTYVHDAAPVAKTCKYKVRAVDANGNYSQYSAYESVTTRCFAPTNTVISMNGKKKPVIKWDKAEGAKKYTVYVATSENGTYKKLTTTSKLTYTHKKAKANVTYFYKITAQGKSGSSRSDYSAITKFG